MARIIVPVLGMELKLAIAVLIGIVLVVGFALFVKYLIDR